MVDVSGSMPSVTLTKGLPPLEAVGGSVRAARRAPSFPTDGGCIIRAKVSGDAGSIALEDVVFHHALSNEGGARLHVIIVAPTVHLADFCSDVWRPLETPHDRIQPRSAWEPYAPNSTTCGINIAVVVGQVAKERMGCPVKSCHPSR